MNVRECKDGLVYEVRYKINQRDRCATVFFDRQVIVEAGIDECDFYFGKTNVQRLPQLAMKIIEEGEKLSKNDKLEFASCREAAKVDFVLCKEE